MDSPQSQAVEGMASVYTDTPEATALWRKAKLAALPTQNHHGGTVAGPDIDSAMRIETLDRVMEVLGGSYRLA